jgi:hypothetical protein
MLPSFYELVNLLDTSLVSRFFSEFFDFTLPVSFHQSSPYSYITSGTNNRTVGGRRKETTCHPIDMKSSNNT